MRGEIGEMRAIKRAYVRGYPNRTGELAEARALADACA